MTSPDCQNAARCARSGPPARRIAGCDNSRIARLELLIQIKPSGTDMKLFDQDA
jgi:hypothetical protein